ncbi:AprI/Inh family metalloprotease inhibitor [Bosea sp. (in: a-proteobacteria)]|uniref:AprI/Inh family metalloprotease inhibitor n=1 Tax=Bosea sp. (in: a-proteobacteria) TaxID=1871050 RepID=UPI0027350740|nr:AprI/Inh family metalloprotease inhibitor [Bosea sp. (in: a-proteobacteria)]MDP3408588.1 AprI/Inh family metalloprotease inhibitor [Bosea sp. (in: a-proteobacteria)]
MTKKTATMAMTLKAIGLLPLLALTACAGSQRFGGPAPQAFGQPGLPSSPPITSAPVTSEPLPPPGGYPVASAQPGALPAPQDPYYNPAPGMPQETPPPAAPQPTEVPTLRGGSGQIATLGAGSSPARPAVSSRDGVIGNWTAKEATGSSCRVQLSSAPALDLYRANASGCSNRDLQRVTAWDYRDGEVYLYQQGGTVVARLRTSGGGAMDGAVTKSGAALSLSR